MERCHPAVQRWRVQLLSKVEVGTTDTVPVSLVPSSLRFPDASAYLDSVERMPQSGLNAENSLVSVAPIGDRVVAWRTKARCASRVTIEWAHGADVLASVMADAEVDWAKPSRTSPARSTRCCRDLRPG